MAAPDDVATALSYTLSCCGELNTPPFCTISSNSIDERSSGSVLRHEELTSDRNVDEVPRNAEGSEDEELLLQCPDAISKQLASYYDLKNAIDVAMTELKENKNIAVQSVHKTFDIIERKLQKERNEAVQLMENEYARKYFYLNKQQQHTLQHLKDLSRLSKSSQKTEAMNLQGFSAINGGLKKGVGTLGAGQCHEKADISETNSVDFQQNELCRGKLCGSDYEPDSVTSLHYVIQHDVVQSNECLKSQPTNTTLQFPCENSFLKFQTTTEFCKLHDFIKPCQLYNLQTCLALPQMSEVHGENLVGELKSVVGEKSSVILCMRDSHSNPTPCHISNICCFMKRSDDVLAEDESSQSHDEGNRGVQSCRDTCFHNQDFVENGINVKQMGEAENGHFEISFTLISPGNYQLIVVVHGTRVSNTPLSVVGVEAIPHHTLTSTSTSGEELKKVKKIKSTKKDLVATIGSRGRNPGEFANPQDVAVNKTGRIYVTDSNNKNVQIFQLCSKSKEKSTFVKRFGIKGRGVGQVYRPAGVCILPSGGVAVSDYDNKVVNLFSPQGKFISRIGLGKFLGPRGICLNQDGHLVVVDNKGCQIFIFQTDGKLVQKFGDRGTEPHQLAGPQYVAVNSQNQFLVTDFYNHCVKVFSPDGEYVRSFGSKGTGPGQFNAPTGICMDAHNRVAVSDWGNNRVQIFTEDGTYLFTIASRKGSLYGPQGVAFVSETLIAVADSGNQSIKVFANRPKYKP